MMEKIVLVLHEDYEADQAYMFEYESMVKLKERVYSRITEIKFYVADWGEYEPYHSHDNYYIRLGEANFRYDDKYHLYTLDEYFNNVKINI